MPTISIIGSMPWDINNVALGSAIKYILIITDYGQGLTQGDHMQNIELKAGKNAGSIFCI